ncbi:MAG: cysteine dioxygenase family protein [Bacteroidales bacterium]|nr:cysteine dioxygenase family protein [Bacteroidales bacterium]
MNFHKQYPGLKNLILSIIDKKPECSAELKEIVKASDINRKELLPFSDFDHPDHQSYGRKLIYENDVFTIYLMSWCPGDFTAIHDHGTTQWGCVLALDDFAHRLYHFKNDKLVLKDDKPFLKGQTASVYNDVIHMMGNNGGKNALSLHIYGTNEPGKKVAQRSRIFYPEINQMTITQGAAYLYHPETFNHELQDFNHIEESTLDDYLALVHSTNVRSGSFKILH